MTNKGTKGDLSIKYHNELRKVDKALDSLAKCKCSKEYIQTIRERLISNLQNDILNSLKENEKYVKVEENDEMMGYKGKKVYINLPAVGHFKGFKFNYFVSDDCVTKEDFEKNPKLEKKSYSMNDVSKLLHAMNKFMAELGFETDGNVIKYKDALKWWRTNINGCKAGDCLKNITGLNTSYWLRDKDKDIAGRDWYSAKYDDGIGSRAGWECYGNYCCFNRYNYNSSAYLFLRLSN